MQRISSPAPERNVTPIPISPRTRTILLLAGLAFIVLLVILAPSLITLLFGGAALALIMSLPVRLLSGVMPRGAAILCVVLSLLALVVAATVILVPLVIEQLSELIVALPELATRAVGVARGLIQPLSERGLTTAPDEAIASLQEGLFSSAQSVARSLLGSVFSLLTGAFGTFLQIFGTLFIAIYLLADIRRFEAAYLRAVPGAYRADARVLWDDLGTSLSRYLGGLLVSLTIQGTLAAIFMLILGVPYAVLLGLWTAATGILPYIGAFLGAIPAVILAFFMSPLTALLTVGAYLLINQIEGNVLTPRIQGNAVRVHPLLVFMAVFAGGEIAGIAGSAFAVPVLAMLRVLVGFFAVRLRVQGQDEVAAATPETGVHATELEHAYEPAPGRESKYDLDRQPQAEEGSS